MTTTRQNSAMETQLVERDGESNIKFVGEQIAIVSNSPETTSSDYSGSVGHSAELSLFRTAGGKYVCQRVGYNQWQGCRDVYEGAVCENPGDIIAFFGHGRLAKRLYELTNTDDSTFVD